MRIFYNELGKSYKPNAFSLRVWNITMPKWIPNDLRMEMIDALRGFDDDLAMIIADDLLDCWNGFGLSLTGIKHVDAMLWNFYFRILDCARQKGINLAYDE